ncbi:glutathione S-transferase theta-1 [Nematostella vectensis]|uniref:glutathione S-transferase theta-1 n=1 Tax=Nematostella vectensis TaxID=45351 RepID=UPI00139037FD|nr:glutathione S-transferase theta-1 [Nematostella vectensis]
MAPVLTFYLRKNCVNCRVVWLYMVKYKLTFTTVDIETNRPPGFSSLSPNGMVPLILDDETTVQGSLAIVLYLGEKYTSNAGLGLTLEQRAKIDSVMCWASSALLRDLAHNYVYPSLLHEDDALPGSANASLVAYGKAEVLFHLNTLENNYLSKNKFLCGKKSCFADCWVAVVLSLLELLSFDFSPWPRVKALMAEIQGNVEYMDVSHAHEEDVRQCCYGLASSTSNLKKV